MAEIKLKQCPFCGGEVIVRVIEPHKHHFAKWLPDYQGGAYIECACGASIMMDTEAEVIEAWNTRKPMQRIVEQLEEQAHQRFIVFAERNGYERAIEIVKAGGVDETN